jgi:hypothetical protein
MWLAEARDGQLVRLVALASGEAVADEVMRSCKDVPNAIVGLDFAVSDTQR